MNDYITLLGADDVARAGRNMQGAAETFGRAVSNLEMILLNHTARAEELVARIETAVAGVAAKKGEQRMDANPPTGLNEAMEAPTAPAVPREVEIPDPLLDFFTYHAPTPEDVVKYQAINEAALNLARVVYANVPPGPDRSAAIRQVREARMTANAGIACRGAKLPY